MRAVIGLSLLLISGVLMYEAVKGNALNIINTIRGAGSSGSMPTIERSKSNQPAPQNIQTTPSNPPGGIFKA